MENDVVKEKSISDMLTENASRFKFVPLKTDSSGLGDYEMGDDELKKSIEDSLENRKK